MPVTAMDWIDALDTSFARGMQPLLAYQQEQRRLREQNRLRQQQLEDERRQRGYQLDDYSRMRADRLADVQEAQRFTTEQNLIAARREEARDLEQRAFQQQMAKDAAERTIQLRRVEWEIADQAEKKRILTELRRKAGKLGILEPPTEDFETAFDYYNRNINDAESKTLVNLIQQGVELQQEFSNLTGSTEQERAALQMNILLGSNFSDATSVLTSQEKLALQRDPSAIVAIEDRLAKDKSSKGKMKFDAFNQALNDADAQATAIYSKRTTQNKERLKAIEAVMGEHRNLVSSVIKEATLGPDAATTMYTSILDTLKARQQPAVQPQTRRMDAKDVMTPGPPPGAYQAVPVTPSEMNRFTPRTIPRVSLTPDESLLQMDPYRGVSAPTMRGVPRAFSAFGNQVATPQLDQFLQMQNATNSLFTPTAFPAVKIPQNVGAAP